MQRARSEGGRERASELPKYCCLLLAAAVQRGRRRRRVAVGRRRRVVVAFRFRVWELFSPS